MATFWVNITPNFNFYLYFLILDCVSVFFSIVEIFKRSFVFSNYKSCCFWWHSPCHRAAHHAQMMKQTEDMILLFLLANISLRLDAAIISSLSANFFQINFNHCNTTNFSHLRLARQQALVNLWREMGLQKKRFLSDNLLSYLSRKISKDFCHIKFR